MGTALSRTAPDYTALGFTPESSSRTKPGIPVIRFRVLVIGRANAGKTSILQRVCETTESPIIYRGNEEVRHPSICFTSRDLLPIGYT